MPCEPFPVTRVCLELGPEKVFACALDWAGWCRIGRCEERAVDPSPEGRR